MKLMPGSRATGARFLAGTLLGASLLFCGAASADTIFSVNGVEVDSAVVDLYFGNRLGNPNAQPTPEQREVLIRELKDIYLLSTQANSESLLQDPAVAAQIELQKRSILAGAAASQYIEGVTVGEEELLAAYNQQVELAPKQQYKASHILVESQGEAIEIIGQLDGGADFAELAKEKSVGPTGPNGGDLGWFSPNTMVAPFSQAVTAMENGQYSKEPVQTQFGWHVILRTDSRDAEPPSFDASRNQIENAVKNQKFQAYLESLREGEAE